MAEIFVKRSYAAPVTDASFDAMVAGAAGCFGLHRVDWRRSFLSTDGRRLFCWFSAPDAESARLALRQSGSEQGDPWAGTVHDAPGDAAPPPEAANVLVERSWAAPVTLDAIQAIEDAGASCLETHRVRFVRTFFSVDRKRMVCLYAAPDAEAVRIAQHQAGMPVDAVWSFRVKQP
jgi:hypothetical protein